MSDDTWQLALGQELRVNILARGSETDGRHDMVDAFMLPNAATPPHLHTRYEERLFVTEGELTVWLDEERRVLAPGDFVSIRLNVPHMIKAGAEGARSILVTSPAGFAELIERTATPGAAAGPDTHLDVDLFTSVSAELGDVILGPPGMTPAQAKAASNG